MNKLDNIIFEIGDMIHVRYKGFFKRTPLTAKEIINSIEFVNEFQLPFPELSNLVLSRFYEEEKQQ